MCRTVHSFSQRRKFRTYQRSKFYVKNFPCTSLYTNTFGSWVALKMEIVCIVLSSRERMAFPAVKSAFYQNSHWQNTPNSPTILQFRKK